MIIDVQGVQYNVEMWGNGFPILLLHGFTGNSKTWEEFKPYWQSHSKAIAVDIIGHGKTDSPDDVGKYDIEIMADALHSVLDQLGIKQTDLLGYSMGGRLALTFALKYPEKVRKMILESSTPGLENQKDREDRQKQDLELGEWIEMNGMERFVERWENIPLFQSQKSLSASIRHRVREERLSNCTQGLKNSLLGMGTGSQPSWWNDLDQLIFPVLLITGSLDEKFCRIAERMSKQITSCEWMKVESVGHAIHVENPKIFGTIVSGFIVNGNSNK